MNVKEEFRLELETDWNNFLSLLCNATSKAKEATLGAVKICGLGVTKRLNSSFWMSVIWEADWSVVGENVGQSQLLFVDLL